MGVGVQDEDFINAYDHMKAVKRKEMSEIDNGIDFYSIPNLAAMCLLVVECWTNTQFAFSPTILR